MGTNYYDADDDDFYARRRYRGSVLLLIQISTVAGLRFVVYV